MKIPIIDATDYDATDKFIIDNIYNKINDSIKRATSEDMKMFILIQQESKEFPLEKLNNLKYKIPLFNIIENRLSLYDYTLDHPTTLFITYLAETPGNAIIYLTHLQVAAKKFNLTEINMFDIGIKIFSTGFPTNESLNTIWNNCKVSTNKTDDNIFNFVDIASPYQSSKRKLVNYETNE